MPRKRYTAPPPGLLTASPAPRSVWLERYGQLIVQDGIAPIPTALYLCQGELDLTAQEVWFIACVLAHKWDTDLPRPSLAKMAGYTGVSKRRLQEIKQGLCAAGLLLIRNNRAAHGGQEADGYDFTPLFARLEALLAARPPTDNSLQGPAEVPLADPPVAVPGEAMSFLARFGQVILRAGIATVPRALFTHQAALHLTMQQVWFTGYILAHQWTSDLPYPSIKRMAARTGYTEGCLHDIKQALVDQGYLILVARRSADGGKDTNAYDFGPLLTAITEHLHPAPSALTTIRSAMSYHRTSEHGGLMGRLNSKEGARSSIDGGMRSSVDRGMYYSSDGGVRPGADERVRPSVEGDALQVGGRDAPQLRGRGAAQTRRRRKDKEEKDQEDHSSQLAPNQDHQVDERGINTRLKPEEATVANQEWHPDLSNVLPPRDTNQTPTDQEVLAAPAAVVIADDQSFSPANADLAGAQYIAAVLSDFSRELGDTAHEGANITQALHLWRESGLSAHDFVTRRLYEARRRTRRAQGAQGTGHVANKMAYFFAVVRDL